jgi:prepilin-type N-terminal cleavage/methylation domain-containing protein
MKTQGFSLIELLVSSALIFFLLTGTAQLILLSCGAKKKAEFHLTAASSAGAKLEYLKSLPFESAELDQGRHEESFKDTHSEEIFWREWKVEDVAENMKKVALKIFSPANRKKTATFVLLISRELEF